MQRFAEPVALGAFCRDSLWPPWVHYWRDGVPGTLLKADVVLVNIELPSLLLPRTHPVLVVPRRYPPPWPGMLYRCMDKTSSSPLLVVLCFCASQNQRPLQRLHGAT